MFKSLLRLRLRAFLEGFSMRGSKNKSKKRSNGAVVGMTILYAFLFLYLIGVFAVVAVSALSTTLLTDNLFAYFLLFAAMGFLLSVIGSIMPAKAALFESKDNELLLSMPIPPYMIFASRMVALYISALFYTALPMLPAGIVYIVFAILHIAPFSVVGTILYILLVLTLSVLSLLISSIFAYLIAWIGSKMKHKAAGSVIISVLFFAVFFYFWMGFSFNIGEDIGAEEEIGAVLTEAFLTLRGTPFYYLGAAVADANILYFLPVFLGTALLAYIFIRFLLRTNGQLLTANTNAVHIEYREKKKKRKSPMLALMGKELRGYTANATIALNGGMGTLLLIVATVAALLNAGQLAEAFTMIGAEIDETGLLTLETVRAYFAPVLTAALMMIGGYNVFSASSISLEAKTFPILKSLPVSPMTVFLSKTLAQTVLTGVGSTVSVIILTIVLEFPASMLLLSIPALWISAFFFALFGVYINLMMPKFNWITPITVVKQGGAVGITLLVSMLSGIAFLIVTVIFALAGGLGALIVGIMTFVYAAASALILVYLAHGGTRRYERLTAD